MGAAGRTILEMNFAAIGSYVLTLSVVAAGLLLCTDYVLVRLTALVVGKPTVIAARLGRRALRSGRVSTKTSDLSGDGPRVKCKAKRSDAQESAEEGSDDEESEPSIKMRGKRGVEEDHDDEARRERCGRTR